MYKFYQSLIGNGFQRVLTPKDFSSDSCTIYMDYDALKPYSRMGHVKVKVRY